MALKKELYAGFEAIVGARNISQDPAVLETYRCAAAQSSAHYGPFDHRTPTPEAVLLPATTAEVQAIVALCNENKLRFKASSTFWSAMGYVGFDGSIQIDLRRMREITVDPVNMIMTVQSGVNAAMAQAEAMHYGLTCCVPGVGSSSGIIPNTISWVGGGPNTIFAGHPSENMLCAEWVLPSGEVLLTGSAGAGGDWSCGDGPGFSERALFRGAIGTTGDMGICTKISLRLSPYPGPRAIPSVGLPPAYKAKMPPNFKVYDLCFPTWEKWAEAFLRLGDSEAIWAGHRQFAMFGADIKAAMLEILIDPDKQLCDLPELMKRPDVQATNESMRKDVCVIIAGMTPEDLEWKEECIDRILELTGGWKDPRALRPDLNEWLMLYFLRMGHKNLNFALCGSYEGHFGLCASNVTYSAAICEEAFALREKVLRGGGTFMADVGGDSAMNVLTKTGGACGYSGWEFFAHFDAHDKPSIQGCREFFDMTHKWMQQHGCGGDFCRNNADLRHEDGYCYTQQEHNEMYAKKPYNTLELYQWKVREAFDPNHLNTTYYRILDPACLGEE